MKQLFQDGYDKKNSGVTFGGESNYSGGKTEKGTLEYQQHLFKFQPNTVKKEI